MLLFFSRRIGLTDAGHEIPIAGGGRLTGRIGSTGVGAMTIQTQSADGRDGDNYTVLRARRDVLGNSDVGARPVAAVHRLADGSQRGRRRRRELRFRSALSINGFLAKSATPGVDGGEIAGKGSVVWNDNFLHTQYSLLSVGDNLATTSASSSGVVSGSIRRFRDPLPARVVAQARDPRAAPAYPLQHLHRSVEHESHAHQSRCDTDLKQFSANVRFDLIHRPLSDLFVVYNEQRLTDQPTPVNAGRGLIVKYTHMLAF